MMNYHELTMNQPRNSPEQRKQFLIICLIMAVAFFHAFIGAGGFTTVVIQETGTFPGGEFAYKFTKRDYAASGSLVEHIAQHAEMMKPDKETADRIYSLYFDDPRKVSGWNQRFAVGYLATDDATRITIQEKLLPTNAKSNDEKAISSSEIKHMSVMELWPKLNYRVAELPNAKSAAVEFPFTNGFVSALILEYKVIPALRKYATEHSASSSTENPVVVLTTCSAEEGMCTHYSPLERGEQFLLDGQQDYVTYLNSLDPEPLLDWEGIASMLKKMFPFFFSSSSSDKNNQKEDDTATNADKTAPADEL